MSDEKKETLDPIVLNDSWYWMKGSDGNASVSTTFVTIAFWITTLAYAASMIEKIGPVSFRQFDVGACSVYVIPLLTLYFGRRFTEAKFQPPTKE